MPTSLPPSFYCTTLALYTPPMWEGHFTKFRAVASKTCKTLIVEQRLFSCRIDLYGVRLHFVVLTVYSSANSNK